MCPPCVQGVQEAERRAKEAASRQATEAARQAEEKEKQQRVARLREWDEDEVSPPSPIPQKRTGTGIKEAWVARDCVGGGNVVARSGRVAALVCYSGPGAAVPQVPHGHETLPGGASSAGFHCWASWAQLGTLARSLPLLAP
jgi:hypothetical protein